MKPTDYYTAGLFDGEGTVTMTKAHRTDKHRAPAVSLSSTTKELIDYMRDTYGGYTYEEKVNPTYKRAWKWRLVGDKAVDFLRIIVEALKEPEKIRRATILINEWPDAPRGRLGPSDAAKRAALEVDFFATGTNHLPRE